MQVQVNQPGAGAASESEFASLHASDLCIMIEQFADVNASAAGRLPWLEAASSLHWAMTVTTVTGTRARADSASLSLGCSGRLRLRALKQVL